MSDIKFDLGLASYAIGMLSIIVSALQPIGGIVLSIVGIFISKKEKTEMSKRGLLYSKIGLIVGIIVLIITLGITMYISRLTGL